MAAYRNPLKYTLARLAKYKSFSATILYGLTILHSTFSFASNGYSMNQLKYT